MSRLLCRLSYSAMHRCRRTTSYRDDEVRVPDLAGVRGHQPLSTEVSCLFTAVSPAERVKSTPKQQVANRLSTGAPLLFPTGQGAPAGCAGSPHLDGGLGLSADLVLADSWGEFDQDEPVGGDVKNAQVGDDPLDDALARVGQ